MKKALESLDGYLRSRTYLVGHSVTLADVIAFCNLYLGYTQVRGCISPGGRAERGHGSHSVRPEAERAQTLLKTYLLRGASSIPPSGTKSTGRGQATAQSC